jgi:hypothetical protein
MGNYGKHVTRVCLSSFFLFVMITRQTYSIFYIGEGSMVIHVELHALVVVNVLINFFNFISHLHVFI